MMQDQIKQEYFRWISNLVFNDHDTKNLTYNKLFTLLHSIDFYYDIYMDHNRSLDGVDLRDKFRYYNNYDINVIEQALGFSEPCSVLEMMIALACRIEEQIMDDDYHYGDRTSQWFWNMIVSLGLHGMSDINFNEGAARNIIDNFLNHRYKPNGQGGLFTLYNCKYDLRKEEIWTQAMWYLTENFDFRL